MADDELTERRPHFNHVAGFHFEQMRREFPLMHQIQTEFEPIAVRRSRCDGIGASDVFFADRVRKRNKLAGLKIERRDFGRFEDKVTHLRSDFKGLDQTGLHAEGSFARSISASTRPGWPSRGIATSTSSSP